jgi:RimJ/RimL family protein N-acetyltransferase
MLPEPVTLEGRLVRLVPLALEHHAALCRVGLDPELWRWTWAPVASPDDLRRYIETALAEQASGRSLPFAIAWRRTGEPVGSTRFGNIEPAHRRLEIGWSWLGREYQGTGANAEAKLLLLTHAFESLGAQRVEFKTDALNARSRRALLAIGAREEGVFRKHGLTTAGRVRDTAWYSIVDDEWPDVKAKLAARLDQQAGRIP